MAENQFDSRLARLEERSKVTNRRIDDLEDKTKDMPKFEYLMESFEKSNEKFSNTLISINENLTNLNSGLNNVELRVGELERSQDDNKLDLGKLFKNIFITAVTGTVLWIVYQALGIKN